VDWIHLAQNRWALVNMITNLRVPKNQRISWLAEWLLVSKEGLYSMELVTSWMETYKPIQKWKYLNSLR
jgi:hypothetical protein